MVKKVVSFTIDSELLMEWKTFAEKRSINSSKLVEELMRKYLKRNKYAE